MQRRSNRSRCVCVILTLAFSLASAPYVSAQTFEMHENLVKQLSRVQLVVVGGRIVAQAPQLGGRISSNSTEDDRNERLTIEFMGPQPSLEYELSSVNEQFLVQLKEGERLSVKLLRRSDASEVVPVEFTQEPAASLELAIGTEGDRRVFRAPSLWHLLIDEPEICREHLVPLVEILRPDWRLMQTAAEIEQGMIRAAQSPVQSNREQWSALVAQLASDEFGQRRAADRQLRQAGQAIVPYLESLDPGRLDAEQRFRIRRIVAAMANEVAEDLPSRVSQAAAADPRAWLTLLDREEESLRRLAASQMQELLGEPIDFDAAAEPALRDEQIARLRERFEPVAVRARVEK